jgi:far upstream element-binding protein
MPLEPLHVLIYGSDDFIQEAAPQVDDLLAEAEKAEREGPPPEAGDALRLLENAHGSSNDVDYSTALTLTRPYRSDTMAANASSQSGYRPATVAQLISGNANALDPTLGASPDELMEEEIHIPNGVVGFIIGRGGETISSLQARSGCKVQIQKEHELQPGQTHRVITLQATSKSSIDQCREMIESMVQDRVRAAGGNMNGADVRGGGNAVDAKVQEALALGHALVTMDVPDADVGLIIGKAGSTIKSIQDFTQSQIQIPPSGNADNPAVRTISITSPTKDGAEAAKARIEILLQSKPSYASRGPSQNNYQGPQITIEVSIPDKDVGLCIGRQGCVIKEMQNKTGTRIQIPGQPTPGQPHRVATISGTQEGCEKARILIERISVEQSSACVMSGGDQGGGYHGGYHNQQNAAQSNDPAWQAYYAAQALAQQQQQQQQQAPAIGGAQAPDAYYEQFFRYAYYYGEDNARQYYGAWSPPPGTPNPYGVNPNPSPPPASDASAAPAGAQTVAACAHMQQPSQQPVATSDGPVRDSSMRKVSNLPAWMTKS